MKYVITAAMICLSAGANAQSDPGQKYIESAFQIMDADGDRQISRLEFDTFMLKRMSVQRAAFEAGFVAADVNGDGFIDRREAKINEALLQNFALVDLDEDGKVSREELGAALVGAMQAEVEAVSAASTASGSN
ncbi:EF-hand domain-containing protein [Xanthomonas arboricola pv. corylina]|uniref:EF-hand domain-containing protein n=1 Tax=Xanthomonas arboricola TaxID=56448 RepID=UPI0003A7049A|nr:EF-hand domain-containing protein [Xanthomonas arboricola]